MNLSIDHIFFAFLVAKHKQQFMATEKKIRSPENSGKHRQHQSGSLWSLNDHEIRTKATVKDIEELYSALQGLVPKPSQRRKKVTGTASANEAESPKKPEDSGKHRIRKSHSEKYTNTTRNRKIADGNMNYVHSTRNTNFKDKMEVGRALSHERLFASDTEAELNSFNTTGYKPPLQRHLSLPVYEEEIEKDTVDGAHGTIPKKSKFLLFHRRRPRTKTQKKKGSNWRAFFSTLSIRRKSPKKAKRRSKNRFQQGAAKKEQEEQRIETGLNSNEGTLKKLSPTLKEKAFGVNSTSTGAVTNPDTNVNGNTPTEDVSPEPTTNFPDNLSKNDNQRRDTMDNKSDEVQKKLNAWYKIAVKETTSSNRKVLQSSRSCESLLTDTEILRARRNLSTDTDSVGGNECNRINFNKVRVRKTRANRNRRKERARWQSLPNVKLMSRALDATNKNTDCTKTAMTDCDTEKKRTKDSTIKYVPTVKPLEAKLSFGCTLDKGKSQQESINDFMNVQKENSSRWLTRRCSKTTISCIRPLQLNLFYSESPSRESKCRLKGTSENPSFQFAGLTDSNTKVEATDSVARELALKIRRSSSQRRRKRKSLKHQSRLPHQSPFYLPNSSVSSKSRFYSGQDDADEEESLFLKDPVSGSDSISPEKVLALAADTPRERRPKPKLYSESEDSGWASMDKRPTSRTDTAIQTEPVIVMTAVSVAHRPFLSHVINGDEGHSEV